MYGSFIGNTAKDTVGAHLYVDVVGNENINTAKDSRYLNGAVFLNNSVAEITLYTAKGGSQLSAFKHFAVEV